MSHDMFSGRKENIFREQIKYAEAMKESALRPTWELNGLPSHRNINHHPHTIVYGLYSDPSMISPTWTKLTHTAFSGRAELLGGGYGRRMKNTSISNDMPEFFQHAERHPKAIEMNIKKATDVLEAAQANLHSLNQPHIKGAKIEDNESAYVLPGGHAVLMRKPAPHARYKTYAYLGRHNQRLTLLEPLITERKKEPIVWKDPQPPLLDFTAEFDAHHKESHDHRNHGHGHPTPQAHNSLNNAPVQAHSDRSVRSARNILPKQMQRGENSFNSARTR